PNRNAVGTRREVLLARDGAFDGRPCRCAAGKERACRIGVVARHPFHALLAGGKQEHRQKKSGAAGHGGTSSISIAPFSRNTSAIASRSMRGPFAWTSR